MQEAEDSGILKLKQLKKYKRLVQDPIKVDTPFDLKSVPKYKKFQQANIIKQDHDRNGIINYFIANVYKIFVLLQDRQWQEAFLTCYANIQVIDIFNEFHIGSKHILLMALLLQKMEIPDKAM